MAKRSLIEQLDFAVQALLASRGDTSPRRPEDLDASVLGLLRIAEDLRDLPRPDFKIRLKSDLQRRASMSSAPRPQQSPAEPEQNLPEPEQKKIDAMTQSYRTIAPYIIVPRASEFIDFLVSAFAAVERFRVPRGDAPDFIMHAEVALGNCIIELADANEQIPPAPQTIHLYFDDADEFYARALRAGATSIYAVGEHVSGDRQGAVRDPFGNLWYVSMKGDWTPGPEGVPSVQSYLHLRGSDKMIPFLEKAFGAVVLGHVPTSPEGHVLHATIQIGDHTLEIDEAHGEFQPMPCHMHLHVENSDALYARAITAGATSLEPPSNKPYGRSGGVKDPFGNTWYITAPLKGARA